MKERFVSFHFINSEEQQSMISLREGETRIGQEVLFRSTDCEKWKQKRFHILGIGEDIGPQLNKGFKGSNRGFEVFLPRFLAVQSNAFLNGNDCCIHGFFQADSNETSQQAIIELDNAIENWSNEVVSEGGIPIVVGGGHNNALGLISGSSKSLKKSISVVNLDPHADVRATNERHSGNSFSFAHQNGVMNKYFVLGLHENYNNQFILNKLSEMSAWNSYFESWIDQPNQFNKDVDEVFRLLNGEAFGLELDMDSIAYMPSSAFTPSGITVEQARYYIRKMARTKNAVYLHLPEAAPVTENDDKSVGKTLCYLITDFIKEASNV